MHRLRRAFRGAVGTLGGVPGGSQVGFPRWREGRQDRGLAEQGLGSAWVCGVGERWGLESWHENLHRTESLQLGHHVGQTRWHC